VSQVRIFNEVDELYRAAADGVIRAARSAIQADGRFALLLLGGMTPRRLYALLATPQYAIHIDWPNTHLFWGDERAVPVADPRSNYRMVAETLLSRVTVPWQNIHRIPAELPPDRAASRYEEELKTFFEGPARFHLALLGMGSDGHTASLFPGSPALREAERLVVAACEATPPRITLTFPALDACAEILFLVTGAAKAPALAAVLEGPPDPNLPAGRVQPVAGEVTWLVDDAAAALLRQRTHNHE
jgi:6-phosphogluconolactonase